jgi:hypothetical protein
MPMTSPLLAGIVTAAILPAVPLSAVAAELVPPAVAHARYHYTALWYGPCGCLHVSYVYHRELRTTYGTGFDPRNFDQTEPHYYFGPVRAYPRYWVNAELVQ